MVRMRKSHQTKLEKDLHKKHHHTIIILNVVIIIIVAIIIIIMYRIYGYSWCPRVCLFWPPPLLPPYPPPPLPWFSAQTCLPCYNNTAANIMMRSWMVKLDDQVFFLKCHKTL